jgi:serine/threonine-protein kinase RsbW
MNANKRVIHLHIPSELGYEKVAMGAVRSVAYAMGFSADRIADLQTAVSEACTNAMEHGNRLNAATRVEVVLTVGDRSLEIDVKDKGQNPKPFHEGDHHDIDNPPTDGHAGLGIFLIKHLVDEVEFSAKPQGGQVRMVIYLEPKNGDTL